MGVSLMDVLPKLLVAPGTCTLRQGGASCFCAPGPGPEAGAIYLLPVCAPCTQVMLAARSAELCTSKQVAVCMVGSGACCLLILGGPGAAT